MPVLNSEQLESVGQRILEAAGVPAESARIVAEELRDANLVGHDSHGVIRLMQYVDYIEKGWIVPDASCDVTVNEPGFAIVDGRLGFGQVTARRAVAVGTDKARSQATATVMLRNCNHVGRLGSYAHALAESGLGCMLAVNAPGPGGVAPFGGIDRRLGTNPIAMAVPYSKGPIVLDMTTSASAEGKVRVALQRGETLPPGWIIDSEGNPSVSPADLYGPPPGALLPLGGPLGFKGYGLSVMVDMFAGVLSGSGVCRSELPPGSNGMWMYVLDISRFVPLSEFDEIVGRYAEHLKSSRRAPGVDEILLPGEIEQRRRRERAAAGVAVPDETWRQLTELAARLGTSLQSTQ